MREILQRVLEAEMEETRGPATISVARKACGVKAQCNDPWNNKEGRATPAMRKTVGDRLDKDVLHPT